MERRSIQISGIVQGVGFRPFVHHLATELELGGFVRNESGIVAIEVEGKENQISEFLAQLEGNPPALARIESIVHKPIPLCGNRKFEIEPSIVGFTNNIFVSPDVGACADCLTEIFDPKQRRFHYPFTNCTNCGPRLTIICHAPYDRPQTTMAHFEMCPDCRNEYEDPVDRRFHAQPIACPKCGPQLQVLDAKGTPIPCADPLMEFAARLQQGQIGALKGVGGYHLACDARSQTSVSELRRRKHRDEKPFAVMLRDGDQVLEYCACDTHETALLTSPRRPIVLLQQLVCTSATLAPSINPSNPLLGVMLPYTPLHHLLIHALGGMPLVMTSGNRSDEPIVYRDADAVQRLAGIADVYLTHNRPIHVRCDDSVVRSIAGSASFIRRSRGYAPEPIRLPISCTQPLLAVGGQLKATFALGQDNRALLSHHLGDLDDYSAYQAFERDIALYQDLFKIQPTCLVHDLHPDYASTRYARKRAECEALGIIAVQHHHAHICSAMAEHALTGPVIGVAFDGTGYGTDGAIWGGEFLLASYSDFTRAAHLRYVPLPGGERAIRQPWRMALAYLRDAGCACPAFEQRINPTALKAVLALLEHGLNAPPTSSVGRLFDAVAALLGVRLDVSYEGQAAVELEQLAASVSADDVVYDFNITEVESTETSKHIDLRPMVRIMLSELEKGESAARIARRFHQTLAALIAAGCVRLRAQSGVVQVVLSGGVFLNTLLAAEARQRMQEEGFQVFEQRLVPPGDGGLSLGQLACAAARLHETRK